jgi:chitinase
LDGVGIGTIINDDFPKLSIADVRVTEADSGFLNAVFTVQLSAAHAVPVKMKYATADGTAKAGQDYVGVQGTLTIPAGQTSATISVRECVRNHY